MRFEVAVLVAVAGAADSTASLETSPPPPATHCGAWAKGVSLNGHDITFQVLPSAAACCELCGKTVGAAACTGWTWNLGDHRCYLKNAIVSNTSEPCVSGYTGDGPPLPFPPPSPAPPPPPGAICTVDPPTTRSDAPHGSSSTRATSTTALSQCPWYNSSLSFAQRRDALLAELTSDEKLAVLAGQSVDRLHLVADGFNEALHGVAWAGRATVFPCPMSLGSTWNETLVNTIGTVVAHEALAKHWGDHSNALGFFAPNINIVRDVRWGRAQETYGEDPTLTGTLGAAYVNGMQNPNSSWPRPAVRNVAKHFAAYNLESNFAGRVTPKQISQSDGQYRLAYDANVSRADLLQTFLPAFEDLVKNASLRGVMYNSVNGTPLCANELMQQELRGRMGFDGVVVTDCGAIGFMTSTHHWNHSDGTPYTAVEATAASLAAGTDLNCGGAYSGQLPTAFKESLVTLDQINTAVSRVLYGLLELGVMSDTATAAADPRRQVPMSVVDSAPHRQLAKEAAAQGVVLLKNNDHTLPLGGAGMTESIQQAVLGKISRGRARPLKLAVVGPNANRTLTLTSSYSGCKDRAGGPILPTCTFVNPLQGIQAAAAASSAFSDAVAFAPGVDIDTPDTSGIPAAVAAASDADVVVVIGGLITCQETGAQCQEAEARDRSTPVNKDGTDNPYSTADIGRDYGIGLPGQQLALLQTLANSTKAQIVLVIMSGSAVAVPWAAASSRVGAIVQHFYAGVLGGEALAEVLFGTTVPSGKLPVMIPTSEEQLPVDYLDQSMLAPPGRTSRYFTGTPLYHFGFGMGYSTFTYAGVTVSRDNLAAGSDDLDSDFVVSVLVTNNGEYTGGPSAEVVMVHATPTLDSPVTSTMAVPRQMLVGFVKIEVAPGKTVEAQVRVAARRLQLVGPDDAFELLRGKYTLHVGGRNPAPQQASSNTPLPLSALISVS